MTRSTHTLLYLIMSVLALLLSLAILTAVYLEIKKTSTAVVEGKEKIKQEGQRDVLVRSLERLYQETTKEREELMEHVIASSEVADFIEYVEEVGRSVGVTLEVGTVDLVPRADGFTDVVLTMRASGSWERILRFTLSVENLPFGVRVRSASYDYEGGKWSGTWTLQALAQGQ